MLLLWLLLLRYELTTSTKFEDTNWFEECPWDPPDTPLNEKDVIGRLKFIINNSTKLLETLSVVKTGKTYSLGHVYYHNMPKAHVGTFMERNFSTKFLYAGPFGSNQVIYSQQEVNCKAMGNVATQFDGLGQIFFVDNQCNDTDTCTDTDISNYVFYNNFRGNQVIKEYGVKYLGIEEINQPIITRAILIDIAGFKNVNILNDDYEITLDDMKNALKLQKIDINSDILFGDMLIFYSGWGQLFINKIDKFWLTEPGIGLEIVDWALNKGIVLMGSDAWGLEVAPNPNKDLIIPVHHKWLTCHGGYIHELLYLDEWLNDARNNIVPWIGAYVYHPLSIKGAVGSPGAPIIML